MKKTSKGKIIKIMLMFLVILLDKLISFNFIYTLFIRQEAPYSDGIWANPNRSFIFDTDDTRVKITSGSTSETLEIAYSPGINFIMYYPLPDGINYVDHYVHRGEIYRIFDYVYVKCEDGCFETWLKKVEPPVT